MELKCVQIKFLACNDTIKMQMHFRKQISSCGCQGLFIIIQEIINELKFYILLFFELECEIYRCMKLKLFLSIISDI